MAPRYSIRPRRHRSHRVRVFVDPARLLPRPTAAVPTIGTMYRVLDGLRRLPLAAGS